MITPEITIKRALLLSLCLHITLFLVTGPRFQRKTMRYWISSPVELVSLPSAETTTTKPVEQVKPVPEKKKVKEIKKAKAKKAEPRKEIVVVKLKDKIAEPKPEAKTVAAAAPEPVPVAAAPAPVKTQSTAIVPDVTDFPFLYYLNIIQKKVTANWNFDYEGVVHKKVVVFFKIDKAGKVYDQKVEQSSGISFLDQSALRAVLLSSPFPPLPEEYSGNFLGVHFGFEFKKEG
ncbi:MAG: TonB family protein [bacterium]|nr:TonB family protein [bacterium]